MPSFPRYGRNTLTGPLAFAVLGWAMLSPSPAAAACGDYVQILNQGEQTAGMPGGHDPGPASPCRGPSCERRAPLAPPAPPAPPSAPQAQPDAVLPPAAAADPPRSGAVVVETDPRPPVLSTGVFRPPRA